MLRCFQLPLAIVLVLLPVARQAEGQSVPLMEVAKIACAAGIGHTSLLQVMPFAQPIRITAVNESSSSHYAVAVADADCARLSSSTLMILTRHAYDRDDVHVGYSYKVSLKGDLLQVARGVYRPGQGVVFELVDQVTPEIRAHFDYLIALAKSARSARP